MNPKNNSYSIFNIVISYLPLIILNVIMPIYWLNLRPINGYIYYIAIVLIGILILGPACISIFILGKRYIGSIFTKIILFLVFLFVAFGVSSKIAWQRKEKHLRQYGDTIYTIILKKEKKNNNKRFHFMYTVNSKKYHGILDFKYYKNPDEYDSILPVTVSSLDPRIYDSP
jgi:hypothetical protein